MASGSEWFGAGAKKKDVEETPEEAKARLAAEAKEKQRKKTEELRAKGYHIDRKRDRLIGRVDAIRISSDFGIIPSADNRGDDAEATITDK